MAVMAGLGVALALSSPLEALAEEARADAAPASVTDAAAAPLAEGADPKPRLARRRRARRCLAPGERRGSTSWQTPAP